MCVFNVFMCCNVMRCDAMIVCMSCAHACMHVGMYVMYVVQCMQSGVVHVCMHACNACMHACMYVCIVCMHVCMYCGV